MNKVVIINGSPKPKGGACAFLIEQIKGRIQGEPEVHQAIQLAKKPDLVQSILSADCILVVFPLYVDTLPAPLIRVLTMLEKAATSSSKPLPKVFAVSNCGFFEQKQIDASLNVLQCFCNRTGFVWQYAIAIGAGGMLMATGKDLSRGPFKNTAMALDALGKAIDSGKSEQKENVFVGPQFPRFLYLSSAHMSWRISARKNGAGKKLKAKPHLK